MLLRNHLSWERRQVINVAMALVLRRYCVAKLLFEAQSDKKYIDL